MRFLRLVILAMLISLLPAISNAGGQNLDDVPIMTANLTVATPIIDGVLSEREFQHASCVTGFFEGSSLAARQTKTYITYDKDNLYLAFLSPIAKDGLVADITTKDGNVWLDDAIELFLSPRDNEVYRFIFNSNAALYDSKFGSNGEDTSWDSEISIKCSTKNAMWVCELCIPFKNLDLSAPKNGDTWRVNFCRDWKKPMEWTAWSPSTSFVNFETLGHLVFKENAPYLQLQNIEVKNGKVSIRGKLGSIENKTKNIVASFKAYESDKAICNQVDSLKIVPGKDTNISVTKDLYDTLTDRLLLTVADKDTQQVLAVFAYNSKKPLAPSAINVDYIPYEYKKKALVVVDATKSRSRSTGMKGSVELYNLNTGRLLVKATLSPFKALKAKAYLDIRDVIPGRYNLVTMVTDSTGKVIHRKETTLTKPSDDWVTADKLPSDEVLWPWTPMSSTSIKNTVQVKCWGREYSFNGSPFPTGIITQGQQILASPISLSIKTNKQQTSYRSATLKLLNNKPAAVGFTAAGKTDNIKINTKIRVEFDGLMVFDVTLTPTSPTAVTSLALNLPLKAEYAKFMQVPGRHLISGVGGFSGATGSEEGWIWKAPFAYYMWVGNEDCGIQWFTESNSNWKIGDIDSATARSHGGTARGDGVFGYSRNDKNTICLTRNKGAMLWQFNIVQKPIILSKPVTISFGLQVTPVKPRPTGWRGWGIQRDSRLIWTTKQSSRYFGYAEVPEEGKAWHKELVDAIHAEKKKALQYAILTQLSEGSPEYQYYHKEWESVPGWTEDMAADVVAMGNAIHGMCPESSGWIDFISHKQARFVKDNNLDGVYWDNSWPWFCSNENHGCQDKYPILAFRELYKRTYAQIKHMGNDKLVYIHCSGGLVMPMLSFCDGYVTGEQFSGQVNKNDFYMDKSDWFKAESMGRPYGLVPLILPMARGAWANKDLTENFMGMALLHDAGNIAFMGGLETGTITKIWGIMDAFGISKNDVEFIPYWSPEKCMVSPSGNDIKTSVYVRKGLGCLIVIGNSSNEQKSVVLQPDFNRLAVKPEEVTCTDEMSGQKITLDKGPTTLDIPARGFRIITIKRDASASFTGILLKSDSDAFIDSRSPDAPKGDWDSKNLYILNTNGSEVHTLVNFDLSSIAHQQKIVSAVLKLQVNPGLNTIGYNQKIQVHAAKCPWTQLLVTWNAANYSTAQKWALPGGDYDTSICGEYVSPASEVANPTTLAIDITPLVQEWINGTSPNYGLILTGTNGTCLAFYSKETDGSGPTLEIETSKEE